MNVIERLRAGEFANKIQYPDKTIKMSRELRLARKYQRGRDEAIKNFQDALEAENGMVGHPKAQKVWDMAWVEGHSSGLETVIWWYEELVDLIKVRDIMNIRDTSIENIRLLRERLEKATTPFGCQFIEMAILNEELITEAAERHERNLRQMTVETDRAIRMMSKNRVGVMSSDSAIKADCSAAQLSSLLRLRIMYAEGQLIGE